MVYRETLMCVLSLRYMSSYCDACLFYTCIVLVGKIAIMANVDYVVDLWRL